MPVFLTMIGLSLAFYVFCLGALYRDRQGRKDRPVVARKVVGSSLVEIGSVRGSSSRARNSLHQGTANVVAIPVASRPSLRTNPSPALNSSPSVMRAPASQSDTGQRRIAGGAR